MSQKLRWDKIKRGDSIPSDAVFAGETSTDGEVWVGRYKGEPGKINIEKDVMYNFWGHSTSMWESHHEVEILCCEDDHRWLSLQRGQPMPEQAVKAGITESDGETFVARFNGEVGKINTQDGRMYNFWGHHNGRHECAEVLIIGAYTPSTSLASNGASEDARALSRAPQDRNPAPPRAMGVAMAATLGAVAPKCLGGASTTSAQLDPGGYKPAVQPPPAVEFGASQPIRVLQFNIWNEGNEIPNQWAHTVDITAKVNADIVTFSEVRNWGKGGKLGQTKDFHERMKLELLERGLTYHGSFADGGDVGLISKFPIDKVTQVTKAARSTITAYFMRTPRKLCVCSAHLDWKEYALNMIRGYDGNTFMKSMRGPCTDVNQILDADEKSGRGQALRDFVEFTKTLDKDTVVILAGDFNECSHLDWTEETKDLFGHNGLVIPWDHSQILEANGFQDTWRFLYPNPVTHLGATWPSTCSSDRITSWAKSADERDRIDFVYHNCKGSKATEAYLVGPESYFVFGEKAEAESQGPFLDAVKGMAWPSDHKGLLVHFEIEAAVLEGDVAVSNMRNAAG